MGYFTDKVVWVTGASSGIGEGLAYEFSKAGVQLIISSRKREALEEVKNKCAYPDKVYVSTIDLADTANFQEKVDDVIAKFGQIDIMVHNAGLSQRDLAVNTSIDIDKRLMDVNYIGTVALTKTLLPHLLKKKAGHFVVVTSLTGKFGSPYRSSYAASKHALHGFFDSLRAELTDDNIKVTLICPAFIKTNVSINAIMGDGSTQGTMDEKTAQGMPADECARHILKAVRQQKFEALVGYKETYYVLVKRLFPNLFTRLLAKAEVK